MQIDYTKEETLKLIEEYYKKLEGRDVKASVSSKKECVGFYEQDTCVTTFTISEEMEIAGMKKKVKQKISNDELNTLLKALFNLYDFELTDIVINDGINTEWEGYGMCEHQVKTPYFKGITIDVKKKVNQTLIKE